MHKKPKIPNNVFLFLAIILLGLTAGILASQNTLQTRSKAEDISPTPLDCASDTQREDYCGESAPFRGCNAPPAEWICQCRLPSGKWWSECSVMEDSEGKQKYRDKCGGDEQKAFSQWKYDIALSETQGKCSCGGQNLCGSLVRDPNAPPKSFPSPEKPIWPTQRSQIIDTPIPSPTLIYQAPKQPLQPTSIYIPPTSAPIIYPTSVRQQPSLTPARRLISIPEVKINFEGISKFFSETKKSIMTFFSQVLP